MSQEPEDFNAFTPADCFGATLMLGLTPAILNFVFNDMDIVSTACWAGGGFVVACIVWLAAFVTRWRIIGEFLNIVGMVLTIVYIAVAVYFWWPSGDKDEPAPDELPAMPAEAAAVE